MTQDNFESVQTCQGLASALNRCVVHAQKAAGGDAEARQMLVGFLRGLLEDGSVMTLCGLVDVRKMLADWDEHYIERYAR